MGARLAIGLVAAVPVGIVSLTEEDAVVVWRFDGDHRILGEADAGGDVLEEDAGAVCLAVGRRGLTPGIAVAGDGADDVGAVATAVQIVAPGARRDGVGDDLAVVGAGRQGAASAVVNDVTTGHRII